MTKKNPALKGEEEGRIIPVARDSIIHDSMASSLGLESLYW